MEKNVASLQELMLRRKSMVLLDRLDVPTEDVMNINDKNGYMEFLSDDMKRAVIAATVSHNMIELGYVPSKELMDKMLADEKVSQQINSQIIPELKKLKGADVQYNPMYKNFPREVMESTDAELYINAIFHYLSSGKWSAISNKEEREKLEEKVKVKTIGVGGDKECQSLFTNILNSNIPYSPQDYADINILAQNYDIYAAMPDFIVNRENLAMLTKTLYDNAGSRSEKIAVLYNMNSQVKSVNDVLRIANVIFGDGDATLTEKIAIKNIKRPERKALMSLLEKCMNVSQDMKINQKAWIRMGEILHPGEFAKDFPNAYRGFESMRSNAKAKDVRTYNSRAEEAITSNDMKKLEGFAEQKPGVIARNLDRIVRESENPMAVLNLWKKISPEVAPVLLWQVHSHFKRRYEEYDQDGLRIFVTKGKNSTTKVVEDTTKKVDASIYKSIVDITEKALKEVYKDKPQMGKVYIAPEIARCKVPNGTRDASMSSAPMSKGSRLPLAGNANIVRGFIWWTNIADKFAVTESEIPEGKTEKEYIDFVKKVLNERKYFTNDSYNKLMYQLGAEDIEVKDWSSRKYKPFEQAQYASYNGRYEKYCSSTVRNLLRRYSELQSATHQSNRVGHSRVDVDLSAAMMDKDLKLISRCSFYDLSGQCYTHSGDIVDGGDANGAGVAEFIDIDLNKAKEQGVRYFVFTVNSYTSQPYSNMEHMHFGFMEREEQEKGEIFEPSTVSQKVKLNAPSTSATVCMFDIEKREMIWMDEVGQDIFKPWHRNNTVDANWHGTSMVCYKALHMEKPNLDDVIRVNVEARGGEIIYDKSEADLVFDLNEGITPMDIDYFSGELIPAEVAPEYIPKEEPEVKEEPITEISSMDEEER